MAVLAIKTEPKCKLCQHDRRAEIDALLELRSNLTRDPETKKLTHTTAIVLGTLAEWGVVNPTEENLKVHWKKHCEKVSEERAASTAGVALALIEDLRAGGQHADTDENLRLVGSLWRAQIEEQIERGEVPKVPHDVMLKAAAELTRRASSETQHTLLTMFAQGAGDALKIVAGVAVKQLEAGEDVIDQEPVEEAELVA